MMLSLVYILFEEVSRNPNCTSKKETESELKIEHGSSLRVIRKLLLSWQSAVGLSSLSSSHQLLSCFKKSRASTRAERHYLSTEDFWPHTLTTSVSIVTIKWVLDHMLTTSYLGATS